jgi:hypothetical protein
LDSDQPFIDIYRETNDLGFRVQMNGFDFSSLGSAKSLLAGENMKLLADRLASSSSKTLADRSYPRSRPLLDQVWELDSETDHMGPLRAGFEKRKKTKISTKNNLRQFTKYSRLQRLLILERRRSIQTDVFPETTEPSDRWSGRQGVSPSSLYRRLAALICCSDFCPF